MDNQVTPVTRPSDGASRSTPTYRSGTAARLSGIPVETLRVWERRYELVSPHRSDTGHREYSIEEVKHLILIKQLVDRGNPIGAIAHLAPNELRAMLNREPLISDETLSNDPTMTVFIVAERMSGCLAGIERYSSLIRVVEHRLSLQSALSGEHNADLLMIEMSEISDVDCIEIDRIRERIKARGGLILYRFARHEALRKLRSAGYVVARVPTDVKELESLCRLASLSSSVGRQKTPVAEQIDTTVPAVRFDDQAMQAIVLASNSLQCECPRHLVEILQVLGSFERYSLQCENRNVNDEKLHQEIYRSTAKARAIIESALEKVARADNLPLPENL